MKKELQIFLKFRKELVVAVLEDLELNPENKLYDVCVRILKENGLRSIDPLKLYGEVEAYLNDSHQDVRMVSLHPQEVCS